MTLIDLFFYFNGLLTLVATVMALTVKNAVHGLLYFIVSVLALAVSFYLLDAPLAAALEVMVYAGAIMVLFVFVVMLLNIGSTKQTIPLKTWAGPLTLALILVVEMAFILGTSTSIANKAHTVSVKEVAVALFTDYAVGIEVASLILLAGLVGAFHIGRKRSSL